jgi:hypothetical protein
LLGCAVAVLPLIASAQENDVVYLNAYPDERKTCVLEIGNTNANANPSCPSTPDGYLVQGKRAQFRVVNRKFFSDYSINIDGVTQLKQIAIQDLDEAANLQTPIQSLVSAAPKGAAPKGLSTAGQLTLRSAQDLLAELVDEGKASNPASELQSDALIVEREAHKVKAEYLALNETWDVIDGASGPTRDCQASLGAPTLSSTVDCLEHLNSQEREGIWSGTGPFGTASPGTASHGTEDDFRSLTIKIGDAITLIKALSSALQQISSTLSSQFSALDGDLAQWKADLNTLRGNLGAAADAGRAYNDLSMKKGGEKVLSDLRRAQIKLKLMQDLNGGAGAAKPVLDDAELNQLVGAFSHQSGSAIEVTNEQAKALTREIHDIASRQITPPQGSGDVLQYYFLHFLEIVANQTRAADTSLYDAQVHLAVHLPEMVDRINARQSQVLARANEIYDHSAVPEPLDKVIDLSKNSGNLRVYFTVRRVDVFPRYNVPVITVQGSAPPPVLSPPPPATTTTSPPPTSQDMSSGTVVAHGSFEVHDFYRATVVAAFTFSTIKNQTVASRSITSGQANDGTPCTPAAPCSQPFLDKGSSIPSVVVGLNYYFSRLGHDTFPGARNSTSQKMGVFGGLSADRLNSYLIGIGYQPTEALQLTTGFHAVSQDNISGSYSPNQVYPGTPSFGGKSTWSEGAYFGVGLNLSIFRKVFGSVTGLGTKATGAGS